VRIYVLRHGIAEDAPPGGADGDRALTHEGKQKLRSVLERAQRAGVRPSVILTSPLKRAVETAEIAQSILDVEQDLVRTNALVPSGSPERVWKELRARKAEQVLITGHEPLLSTLVAFLLGCDALLVRLKKGALVCVDVEAEGTQPHGVLNWMLISKLAGQ
jgi:phosphohistidine phosphatase